MTRFPAAIAAIIKAIIRTIVKATKEIVKKEAGSGESGKRETTSPSYSYQRGESGPSKLVGIAVHCGHPLDPGSASLYSARSVH